MRRFTRLFAAIDQTNSTNGKVQALVDYLADVPAVDAAWAVYFLSGQRLKRHISQAALRLWIGEHSGYPDWLVEEAYAHVGDLAETIALLIPDQDDTKKAELPSLSAFMEQFILPLRGLDEQAQRQRVIMLWQCSIASERFIINKLLTGSFRVGMSKRLVTRALAIHFAVDGATIAHRLMGNWEPTAAWFVALGEQTGGKTDISQPYPFFLASPLDDNASPEILGPRHQWLAEWKWDGIRAQIIRRGQQVFIWSRGEELMEGRYPELEMAVQALPDGVVLDGEILAWKEGAPLPFNLLQQRINRLKPTPALLRKAPVAFLAYDLLEYQGLDWRHNPLHCRRQRLAEILKTVTMEPSVLILSPTVEAPTWDSLSERQSTARERRVEGIMLKRLDSPYRVGRVRGDWWKWKVEPITIDAVMIYAQAGHGRRSNLYTDYTFAIWDNDHLVPIAKAYSGLDDKEISRLDRWIRQNTLERFGPVRSVKPAQVFELACEGINRSGRHKSGVAVRFPRIKRWRTDLDIKDADHLQDILRLLPD